MTLIHVARDLEKLTGRTLESNSWSFQKKGWFGLAIWTAMMPGLFAVHLTGHGKSSPIDEA